jgi:DNA mismatch repair protein MutS2
MVVTLTADTQAAREAELARREKEAERERAKQAKAYLLEARKRVEEALALAKGAADEAAAKEARRLVEEGVRTEARRLDESDDEVVRGTDGQRLAVGVRVRLTTGATGEVAELRPDGKAVVVVGTMRLVVKSSTLVMLRGEAPKPKASTASLRGDEPVRDAATELDLRGMRADEAESLVIGAIDAAVLAERPELRIIHGMGTGVLRDVVRRLLKSDRRIASFDFAPRQQGGTGVTVAVLR